MFFYIKGVVEFLWDMLNPDVLTGYRPNMIILRTAAVINVNQEVEIKHDQKEIKLKKGDPVL